MNDNQKSVTQIASTAEVDTFLRKLDQGTVRAPQTRGHLLFALDATGSRQATWDRAAHIQTEMFLSAQSLGGLKSSSASIAATASSRPAPGSPRRRRCCG